MFEALIMALLVITVVGLAIIIMIMDSRMKDMRGFINRIERENQDLMLHNRTLSARLKKDD